MSATKFEYGLVLITCILIISIVIIILYRKSQDESDYEPELDSFTGFNHGLENNFKDNFKDNYNRNDNPNDNPNDNLNDNPNDNPNYLKVNSNSEHFTNLTDIIMSNNSNITGIINSINNLSVKNPSLNMIYSKEKIDNSVQSNIATLLNTNTDVLIANANNGNARISNNVTTLENQITDLENIINKLQLNNLKSTEYQKIKSLNNGSEITLSQTPNTIFIDPATGVQTNGYMVNLNEGCLSVGAVEYDVYKCNDTNPKHLFKMEHIINEQAYDQNIDKSVPFDNIDKSKINYPFVLMRSVNNKNCLTNQNNNITVQPCESLIAQRWLAL